MSNVESDRREPTAVDDVRRVREEIAAQHGGNMQQHMEETNRLFETIKAKLNLKPVVPPNHDSRRDGTKG